MNHLTTQNAWERKDLLEAELKAINKYLMSDMNWKKKTVECLAKNETLMTTIELLACLLGDHTFSLLTKDERTLQVTNLSVTLSNLTKEGYVKKIKIPGLKGNLYGLANWFDKDGKVNERYANVTIQFFMNNSITPVSCCS